MKERKSTKKYVYENNPLNDSLHHQAHITEIREQLRHTMEQLEQSKLSCELETQKRLLAENQYHNSKEQNQELMMQVQAIKRQLHKLSKKYSKMKGDQKIACQKCREDQEKRQNIEREREIFMKERAVLKNQIKELKKAIQTFEQDSEKQIIMAGNVKIQELIKKEVQCKDLIIEEQKKIIRFLDDRLSCIELEKLQTLNFVECIDQRLQELQMENTILRGFSLHQSNKLQKSQKNMREKNMNFQQSPNRQVGSIKNLQKPKYKAKATIKY